MDAVTTDLDHKAQSLRADIERLLAIFKFEPTLVEGDMRATMNLSDLGVVQHLGRAGQCNLSDLAQRLGAPLSTMSGVVDRLVRSGLVDRSRIEENRRVIVLALSEAGQAFYRACIARQNASCIAMLAALDPDEQDRYLALTAKIAAAAERR